MHESPSHGAGAEWRGMSTEEKEPFEEMAALANARVFEVSTGITDIINFFCAPAG